MREKTENWLCEMFAADISVGPAEGSLLEPERRRDYRLWVVSGLTVEFLLVTPRPGAKSVGVGHRGTGPFRARAVGPVCGLRNGRTLGCRAEAASGAACAVCRRGAAGLPSVPWDRPEGRFCGSGAKLPRKGGPAFHAGVS